MLSIKESPIDVGHSSIDDDQIDSRKPSTWKTRRTSTSASVYDLLKSPFLWFLSFYYLVVFAAKTSFENWVQLLIVDEKRMTNVDVVGFLSSFETGGMMGSFATGYLTDIFVSKMPNTKTNPRMIAVIIYMLTSVCGLYALIVTNKYLPILGLILGCSLYGNINIFGIVATESAPIHLSGTSHSIVSLAANIGAIIAGYPFSVLAHSYGWTGVFLLLEIFCVICLLTLILTKGLNTKIGQQRVASKMD